MIFLVLNENYMFPSWGLLRGLYGDCAGTVRGLYGGCGFIWLLLRTENTAAIDAATGEPWDPEASLLLRRLKVYRFTQHMDRPRVQIHFCAHCFAYFLKSQAEARAPPAPH